MKTVKVKARVTYEYQVEIPDNEEVSVDLETYCDSWDPVYFAMCVLMENRGVQWDGELLSIADKDTNEVLWCGE